MNLAEIKQFLQENATAADVIDFVKTLNTFTKESVKDYLANNDDGKILLQSLTDKKVTQGIESFKSNFNIDELVEKKYVELHPAETPEQKELRELRAEQLKMKSETKFEKIKGNVLKLLVSNELPSELLDDLVVSENDSENSERINRLASYVKTLVQNAVEKKFRENGRNVKFDDKKREYEGKNPFKRESFNLTEQGKILKDDPELATMLKVEAGIK